MSSVTRIFLYDACTSLLKDRILCGGFILASLVGGYEFTRSTSALYIL